MALPHRMAGEPDSDRLGRRYDWWGKQHFLPYDGLGQNTLIKGLNNAGVGVGTLGPPGNTEAVLLIDGDVLDINTLIPNASGWDLTQATSIDENGNIAGTGIFGGQQRAFVIDLGP